MNYAHIFHAGNFADVMKHLALVASLELLRVEETPFAVIDTHAGAGLYDLQSAEAQKNPEYKKGIQPLINLRDVHPLIDSYLGMVRSANRESPYLRFYPGSPLIARAMLRAQDRLLLCEVETRAQQSLRTLFHGDRRVQIYAQDGYLTLPAAISPKEKRWLALIDPPFEDRAEWDAVFDSVKRAYLRVPRAQFLLWYPIKDRMTAEMAYEKWQALEIPGTAIELLLRPEQNPLELNGCGLLLVNPPEGLCESLCAIYAKLLGWWGCTNGRVEKLPL